jgi:hypothetical protein
MFGCLCQADDDLEEISKVQEEIVPKLKVHRLNKDIK